MAKFVDFESSPNLLESDIFSDHNYKFEHINLSKIKYVKIFEIIIGWLFINLIFATITYSFLYNEITNAVEFTDYFYFGLVTLSTSGYGDIAPKSRRAKIFISCYLLVLYSFILSLHYNLKN